LITIDLQLIHQTSMINEIANSYDDRYVPRSESRRMYDL